MADLVGSHDNRDDIGIKSLTEKVENTIVAGTYGRPFPLFALILIIVGADQCVCPLEPPFRKNLISVERFH